MFNLDTAIANWRRQMLAAGFRTPEVLDELEAHLRDDVERSTRSGANPEQAFKEAALRIGQAGTLNSEFAKDGGANRSLRAGTGRLTLYLIGLSYFWILIMGGYGLLKNDLPFTQQLLGFGALAIAGLSLGRGRWLHRFLPAVFDKRIRTAVRWGCLGVVLAWLPIFAFAVLPNANLTLGQIIVVTLWSLALPSAILGLSEGLDEAVRRRGEFITA